MKKIIAIIALIILLLPSIAYAAEPADSVTEVRSIINETSSSFWTDAQIQGWLYQGATDIAYRAMCIQGSDTITLATGTYEYTATTGSVSVRDIIEVLGAFYISPDNEYLGLKRIRPSQIATLPFMISGPPKYFFHTADKISILPLPTSSENSQLVRIYYARQTPGGLDEDETDIAFVDSGPDTITDASSAFVTNGFKADQTLIVSGSTSNDGTYSIASVVAGTITLDADESLTTEGAAATVTLVSEASLVAKIDDLPEEYKMPLYILVASMALKKEHRINESNALYQLYIENLKTLRPNLYNIPSEVPTK